RSEAPDCNEPRRLAVLSIGRIHEYWRPEIHVPVLKKKRGGHDTDDRVRQLTEAKLFPDHGRIGIETPGPEPVADKHGVRSAETALLRSKIAAKCRQDAQDFQKLRRGKSLFEVFRKRTGKFGDVLSVVTRYRRKRLIQAVPIKQAGRRYKCIRIARIALLE